MRERGDDAEKVTALLDSDYAGQAHKMHLKPKAPAGEKTDAAPQRQARHLAA
jgi:hypothetical protein